MASHSVAAGEIGAHAKTLVAATADSVTFADNLRQVEVVSDGAAALYFTIDGSAPVVGANAAYYMPAVPGVRTVGPVSGQVIKLISSGAPTYSVAKAS
jgi:hypothetical protein